MDVAQLDCWRNFFVEIVSSKISPDVLLHGLFKTFTTCFGEQNFFLRLTIPKLSGHFFFLEYFYFKNFIQNYEETNGQMTSERSLKSFGN